MIVSKCLYNSLPASLLPPNLPHSLFLFPWPAPHLLIETYIFTHNDKDENIFPSTVPALIFHTH